MSMLNAINYASNSTACVNCNFPATCSIASQLCPLTSDIRLTAEPSISCMTDVFPYYYPGAIPIFFVFVLGLPFLFFRLTRAATRLIGQMPIPEQAEGDKNLIWLSQMHKSQNICRGLYYGYKYQWRQYALVDQIRKLLVIAVLIFAIYMPSVTLVIFEFLF
jgi:hypothetical protein